MLYASIRFSNKDTTQQRTLLYDAERGSFETSGKRLVEITSLNLGVAVSFLSISLTS